MLYFSERRQLWIGLVCALILLGVCIWALCSPARPDLPESFRQASHVFFGFRAAIAAFAAVLFPYRLWRLRNEG